MFQKQLEKKDPELFSYIISEIERQKNCINLIASENMVSDESLSIVGSKLTNKYVEGYSGNRYYGGCRYRQNRIFRSRNGKLVPQTT